MTPDPYYSQPGLSQSGMKDLEISPYRYYWKYISGAPWPDPTPEMQFGAALHCLVLEPAKFSSRYACEVDESDFPGCLRTIEDCRDWLRGRGCTPKGTKKAEVISQVVAQDSSVAILDLELQRTAVENADKCVFSKDDWARLHGAATSLLSEPRVSEAVVKGKAEVALMATDPDTGVNLKAKLDLVCNGAVWDFKTFTQRRGLSIDKSVANAIYYEKYYRQAYFYSYISKLLLPNEPAPEFVMAFVESDQPHEVRIKALRPKMGGQPNLYWTRAMLETRQLIRLYAECQRTFGSEPWRQPQDITPLADEDIPQLAW